MSAVKHGNEETVSILCSSSTVKIFEITNPTGENAVDIAVQYGHISIFCKLILTIFEKNGINNTETLSKSGNGI